MILISQHNPGGISDKCIFTDDIHYLLKVNGIPAIDNMTQTQSFGSEACSNGNCSAIVNVSATAHFTESKTYQVAVQARNIFGSSTTSVFQTVAGTYNVLIQLQCLQKLPPHFIEAMKLASYCNQSSKIIYQAQNHKINGDFDETFIMRKE